MKNRGLVCLHHVKSNDSKRSLVWARSIARGLLVLLVFSMGLPATISSTQVMADGGDLVTSFGMQGFVATDIANGHDSANAITATSDGKIVAAGSATITGNGTDFVLARYDGNGVLDTSFGSGGKVTTDFFNANDGARGIAALPDGKFVLSGFATVGSKRVFAIAQYLGDGRPDQTFDQDGKLTIDLGSTSEAFKVAAQPDGKILVVGDSRPQNSLDFTIVRLNTDGSLDSSFGTGGVTRVDFGNADRAIDLAVDGENIFVCGIAVKSATDSDFAVARLNFSNGSLNNEFDGDGKLTFDFSGKQDGAQAIILRGPVAPLTEPHLVVGGFATNATSDFALLVADYRGQRQPLFNQGKETVDLSGSRDQIFRLINQPDGDIVGLGWAGIGENFDLGIVKWEASGKRDISWGEQGIVTLDTATGANNVAFDGMIYLDKIVTAGVGLNQITGNDDFVITQHENEKFVEFRKRGPTNPVVQGDIITYTFEIVNLTDKEIAFQVQDTLSLDLSFDVNQNTGWLLEKGRTVTRNLTVSGGQTALFSLRVRANHTGTIPNTARLFKFFSYTLYKGVEYTLVASDSVQTEVKEVAITEATRDGKNLKIKLNGLPADSSGIDQSNAELENVIEPQASCPVVLFDGVEQPTKRDPENFSTVLVVKKGFKRIASGQTVMIKVRLCDGTETAPLPGVIKSGT